MATTAVDQRDPPGRRPRRWFKMLAVLVVVAVLVAVSPPVRTRAVAFVTVVEGLGTNVPRPFAADVTRQRESVAELEVDRYVPEPRARSDALTATDDDTSVIVLVPGATPAGRDDGRVIAVAEALARAGRTVIVPELDVYGEELVLADVDRIVHLVDAVSGGREAVVLAGISFGGSLSLIAASDERLTDRVALVATFGAYADLRGVVQAVTTGTSLVGDERFPWDGDPRAAEVVRDQVLRLLPSDQRQQLQEALESEAAPDLLPAELQPAYELLVNDDPNRTFGLIDELPAVVRERLLEVSPSTAAEDLSAPIVALHAVDDPVIPYGELARLGVLYPQAELLTLATFDHVGLGAEEQSWWATARDLWQATRFTTRVLEAS